MHIQMNLEHPDIRRPTPDPPSKYQCPICGEDLGDYNIMYTVDGRVVGCDTCIEKVYACEQGDEW